MKTLLTALLWLAGFGIAAAQTSFSPGINYQGRAQDGDGVPVTGEHAVRFSLYDTRTGGSILWTEDQTVTFSSTGIFTAVIGSTGTSTPEPLRSMDFSQQLWLEVEIEGFNGGRALPRLILTSTPYTFYAFEAETADHADSARAAYHSDLAAASLFADSAVAADRAATLALPASLDGDGVDPTLRVASSGASEALKVEGSLTVQGAPYAIVSSGVDSTSEHYIAGASATTTGQPDAGGLYRDNVPIAWGQIGADGTILSDFGITRVGYTPNAPGVYVIYLDNPVRQIGKGAPEFAVVVTPLIDAGPGSNPVLIFPGWDYAVDGLGEVRNDAFQVTLRSFESGTDARFSVVVFGRPAN